MRTKLQCKSGGGSRVFHREAQQVPVEDVADLGQLLDFGYEPVDLWGVTHGEQKVNRKVRAVESSRETAAELQGSAAVRQQNCKARQL